MHCKACDRVIDSKDEELCSECLRAAKAVFNDDWGDDVDERIDYWNECGTGMEDEDEKE